MSFLVLTVKICCAKVGFKHSGRTSRSSKPIVDITAIKFDSTSSMNKLLIVTEKINYLKLFSSAKINA